MLSSEFAGPRATNAPTARAPGGGVGGGREQRLSGSSTSH